MFGFPRLGNDGPLAASITTEFHQQNVLKNTMVKAMNKIQQKKAHSVAPLAKYCSDHGIINWKPGGSWSHNLSLSFALTVPALVRNLLV